MDRELQKKISDWLDAHWEEYLRDLMRIVSIPSVTRYDDPDTPFGPECKQVLDEALRLAESFGMQSRGLEDKCGYVSYRPDDNDISVWCHLDVVPAGDGWRLTEPFSPVIRDGYMIGRGCDDNKGPAIGVMYLLRAFNELGIKTRHALRLCLGCDEEKNMRDVAFYTATQPAAKLNIVADSGFPVCYGEKGIMEVELVSGEPVPEIAAFDNGMASNIVPDAASVTFTDGTVLSAQGVSCHSASPENGINAIHELTGKMLSYTGSRVIAFFNRVNDDYLGTKLGISGSDEISGRTTCAGTMTSRLPDGRILLHLNIRYCISADSDRLLNSIRAACTENGCEAKLLQDSKPNYYPRENPLVDALTDLFNDMTGEHREPFVMGGGTYARKLPNAFAYGLGGVHLEKADLFGPGRGGAHECDEGLHLSSIRKALEIFAMALLEADRLI